MGLATVLGGKLQAARRLATFARYLRNWPRVFAAYRSGEPLPPFQLRGGLTLAGGPDDDLVGIFDEVFVRRCYTRRFYRPSPSDTVVDFGANVGVFALYLQWAARGVRVHAFEPASDTRARLARNVDANGLAGAITIHREAVSAEPGTLTLHRGGTAGHTSSVPSQFTGTATETVECVTLATALARAGNGPIGLLKIDTEGAEADILAGANPDSLARVQRVAVEYHGLFRPGSREAVMAALKRAGYSSVVDRPDLPDGQLGLILASREPL